MRSFEDFPVGTSIPLGPRELTREAILAFADEFAPTASDDDAGLAAGWHVSAVMMRMMVDAFLGASTSQGSPGMDFLNWHEAVEAGDVLSGDLRVLEARRSASRPGLGLLKLRNELRNQDGTLVLDCEYTVMMLMRNAAG